VTYTFAVVAATDAGVSPARATSAIVVAGVPDQVTNVRGNAGNGTISLYWDPPADNGSPVAGYLVTEVDGAVAEFVVDTGSPLPNVMVPGLTNGQSYRFRVTAFNSTGYGPASDAIGLVPAGRPGQVAKPKVVVRGRTVTVSWSAPFTNGSAITGYKVTGVAPSAKVVSGSTTKVVFRNVKPGVHQVRLAAQNGVGWGTASPTSQVKVRA